MIIRILGEGQYEVDDAKVEDLNVLDAELVAVLDTGDDRAFGPVLAALVGAVRRLGSRLPYSMLVPTDLVLPAEDADLDEIRALLRDDGLIPG
jgi:hypothetical protein